MGGFQRHDLSLLDILTKCFIRVRIDHVSVIRHKVYPNYHHFLLGLVYCASL